MSKADQDFSMFSGETKDLVCTVTGAGGGPFNLTGATVRWELQADLLTNGGALITKTVGSGITIANPTGGVFTIRLNPADTQNLAGAYYHEARVTDAIGNVATVFTGTASIQKTAIG